jgi:hypothetical protein
MNIANGRSKPAASRGAYGDTAGGKNESDVNESI